MNYLFVVAHPDDEVLGAGATIHHLIKEGHDVSVCILSNQCNTRYDDDLHANVKKSHNKLGIKKSYIAGFKCLCFKDEPHHEMVQFVENSGRRHQHGYIDGVDDNRGGSRVVEKQQLFGRGDSGGRLHARAEGR